MIKRVLVVDVDLSMIKAIRHASRHELEVCTDFAAARQQLLASPPDALVTNLRLGAYNGLHLIYLATGLPHPPRSVVYTDHFDRALIEEAQRIGAFFETSGRLPYALATYLEAALPSLDRREPREHDRRRMFRGGRRSSDVLLAV